MFKNDELAEFREHIWRKSPLLYKLAIDAERYQVSASTLATLTGNELVESRIIGDDLSLTFGPFELSNPDDEALLPAAHMLMIQCLEQHLAIIDTLLHDEFGFLPRWQVDDVMVSYGTEAATCGAHFDHYDVFLFQLSGSKHWQLDTGNHVDDDLDHNADVRLLASFEPTQTFMAEPGDVLYVPPGVGHHGICRGDSMTLSIGIRNPTVAELLADYSEFLLEHNRDDSPLDEEIHSPANGIKAGFSGRLQALYGEHGLLDDWYGVFVTRLREPDLVTPLDKPVTAAAFRKILAAGVIIRAALPSRLCHGESGHQVTLYVNGERYPLDSGNLDWVKTLAIERSCALDAGSLPGEAAGELILMLVNEGALLLPVDDQCAA